MMLSHELAHIDRLDYSVNIFQRVLEAVFFFHPFLWYASLQLTQEREQICDSYVLAKGVSAMDYTTLLAHVVEKTQHKNRLGAVALMEGRLLSRVRFLLNPERSQKIKLSGWASVATTFVFLLVLCSSTIRLKARTLATDSKEPRTNYRITC